MRVRWSVIVASASVSLALVASYGFSARQPIQNGMSYASWWSGTYSTPDADLSLAHLAETGADWIGLIVTGYQDDISSTTIHTTTATPTDADLTHVITQAHSRGLKVMLKPHVDPQDVEGHWRGEIGQGFGEVQWNAWFASYRDFINHYADLAQAFAVEQFSVGCEFVAATHRASDWRAVVAGVRARYHGPITYAANHSGEEESITWWDAVDFIGVDAYYPLSDKNNPTVAELKAAWAPQVTMLANLSATWGRPILFTEVGYRSQDGANQHPWDWLIGGTVDLQEQADCYQAVLEAFFGQPWFGGLYWWCWGTDPFEGGPCDQGYTPHDKSAEDVLRQWYDATPRPTPSPTPQTDESQTMSIYSDGLGSGWEDWSWSAQRNLASSVAAYSGTHGISITLQAWGALSLWHPAFDTTSYNWFEFYVRRQVPGETQLWISFADENGNELSTRILEDCRYLDGGLIAADVWKRVRIPLSDLRAGARLVTRVSIGDRSGEAGTRLWVDEMRLAGAMDAPGTIASCPLFPADNIWNVPVDTLPLDLNSAAYVNTIGSTRYVHADFGSGLWEGGPIGIPCVVVPGNQPKVSVTFDYEDESDPGPYPVPPDPPIEGGPNSTGDRHVLVVDRGHCVLYELFNAWPQADGSWHAGSGAIFNLNSNALRAAGWTSADAAGLPMLPGLVRYDEVAAGEIQHALRFTAPQTRRQYIWPARHYASSLTGAQYPPMGQRFRLRADFDISSFSPLVQVILRTLKKYGMILADNGSAWYISGVPDERWDNDVLHELHRVHGSDFEAVDVLSLMVHPDSGQARSSGNRTLYVAPSGNDANPGTHDAPWATPGYGSRQLQPGDTLVILGGRYVLSQYDEDIVTPPSGTADAWIVIQGEDGNRPILAGRDNLAMAINLCGASYVRIENLEITHDDAASGEDLQFRDGIEIMDEPASNIILHDLYIHHIDEFGMNFQDVTDLQVSDCRIEYCGFGAIGGPDAAQDGWRNVGIHSSQLSYSGHYYQGGDGSNRPYDRPDGFGIEPSLGPIEILDSVAEHNYGDGLDSKAANTTIRRCIVANNSCDGIKLWADNSRVQNTLIYGRGDGNGEETPWAAIVIHTEQANARFALVNVTVDDILGHNYIMHVQYDHPTVPVNLTLQNTIFRGAGPGSHVFIGRTSQLTALHNSFYFPQSEFVLEHGDNMYTADSIGTLGNGNLYADPRFVAPAWGSNGDYHLEADSPAINHGLAEGAPRDDLEGRARDATPDIGAYEFVGSLPGDMDHDCDVDIVDIMLVASRWNTRVGNPRYDPQYDLDQDGDIDIVDIMRVASRWNTRCPSAPAPEA